MLDRTIAPKHSPPEFKPFPLPQKYQLSGGSKVYLFNQGSQPVFQIELIFPVGSAIAKNPALPALCFEMLREGSTTMSAEEINHKLDFFGAFLGLKPGIENSFITLYGRSEFLGDLIPLLAEIVFQPTFDEQALVKQKKKMVQELAIKQKKTNYWAPRLLRQNIFGEGHPYSKIISPEDIKTVSRKDLVEFHQQHVLPGLQSILLAGAYDNNVANSLVADSLNMHYTYAQQVRADTRKNNMVSPITKSIENATQASIAIGQHALSIRERSYPAYAFLIKILGGYFGSRLMKKLREEEGLTYGIYAYTTHLRSGSYLQIAADVTHDAVDKSIDLILDEINKLKHTKASSEEIDTVKNYLLGEYINNSTTVFDFADLYKKIITQGLRDDYYNSFYKEISSVTPKEVLSIASQVFTNKAFSIVRVK